MISVVAIDGRAYAGGSMTVSGVVAAGAVGYLCGTLPSADIAAWLATRGTVDVRASGSGNPGATNVAQVLGKRWGAAVLVADVAKGFTAGMFGAAIGSAAGAYLAAALAVAGHIWPVWSRFRGGKGVATVAGTCLAVFPAYFPIALAVTAIGAVAARRAERAMQISAALWTTAALVWWLADLPNAWGPEPSFGLFASAAVSALLVLTKFRLARATEPSHS
jgi:glycerol-3-phosphate acyltransferase PlsY